LLGELEAYTEAVRELQKYLKFAPEAPNAQAVQTLIYQWESLTPGNR
jgi:antitoxin component HigA of HigAB toxin-antitoxin module